MILSNLLPSQLAGHFFGVGSLGEKDHRTPLEYIKKLKLPYSYQITSLHEEDMIRQFAACVDGFEDNGDFVLDVDIHSYREITSEDEPIMPDKAHMHSIYDLMDETNYPFFKSQQTAPATMCFSIRGSDGKQHLNRSMFHFFERLMFRIAQAQVDHMTEHCDTIFLCQDDPALGFVKQMITDGKVNDITIEQIIEKTDEVYPSRVIPAYHYCDDWRGLKHNGSYLLWDSKPKLVHIDVVRYRPEIDAEQAERINAFIKRGGGLALGALPNVDDAFTGPVLETLRLNLNSTFSALLASGVDLELIRRNSMVSTQCGLSGASPALTREIHEISLQFQEVFIEELDKLNH